MKSPNLRFLYFLLIILTPIDIIGQTLDMSIFHGMVPRNIGPAGMSGRVTTIDVNLNDSDNIYLGSAAGGVWKSENAGHTWIPIFDHEMAASIGDIEIFQKNPSIIYVATGEGNPRNSQNSGLGMFKSMDGGKSWKHLGLEKTRQIHRVLIHPDNPDDVTIGVLGASWGDSEDRGIYKTTDGGKTWTKVLYVNDRTGVADLVVDPSNPNKMLAAMWEHRRWPWTFKSGGEGSGIYLTTDGGHHWTRLDDTNGLPAGELGRIGLSIAPSNPNYVYAYIESKDNAIYASTDGGYSWSRRSKSKDNLIGDRPFYYADIYVDSKNENRVYSIASTVTVSDDGGKSWQTFAPGNKIHTDHHAFWSHPDDPEFIMIGHDGGLNITHDRGENWWFAENLPLGQFYHLRVDNEFPYNVMGGLQDNGSWIGPSRTWFKGGIRNMYWQRVSVGDGFDVVPDPINPDYGYAMGQAGNLVRYHRPTGQLKKIKPVHPDGIYLRFNWNAGIAIHPIDKKTIYYGSQFLHKSSDYGASWEIISPDLTTNNPEKQKFLESGGLTYDVTGAEFHTTIISIDPSPLDEKIIWVGTDDGNVQVTTDGGATWTNVIKNIPGVPKDTWVTQITSSHFDKSQATVVFDDHRRNNWAPYVYRTDDLGKSWHRLVDESDVRGFTYCFAQDPVEPKLQFIGTEFGLYVSFDGGGHWNKWTNGYPTVPTTDLVVHPRESDLVIGTFGRSFWILDDIRPLRELASLGITEISGRNLHCFPLPESHLMVIGESIGYRDGKIGDALYNGENRPYGALITYFLKETVESQKKSGDQVKIEFLDANGSLVRTLFVKPKKGINRTSWDLRKNRLRFPNQPVPEKETPPAPGSYTGPGEYQLVISYMGDTVTQSLSVKKDPRINISSKQIEDKSKMIDEYENIIRKATSIMDQLRDHKRQSDLTRSLLADHPELEKDSIYTQLSDFEISFETIKNYVSGKEVQGIYRNPEAFNSILRSTNSSLDHPLTPASPNQRIQMGILRQATDHLESLVSELYISQTARLKKSVERLDLKPFGN